MKMTPVISCTILSGLTLGLVHEKSDVPPHTHQESEVPTGPNLKTLSFAWSGAVTSVMSMNTSMVFFVK
jgi:hypothetical protein